MAEVKTKMSSKFLLDTEEMLEALNNMNETLGEILWIPTRLYGLKNGRATILNPADKEDEGREYDKITYDLPKYILPSMVLTEALHFNTLCKSTDISRFFKKNGNPTEIYPERYGYLNSYDDLLGLYLTDVVHIFHRGAPDPMKQGIIDSIKNGPSIYHLRHDLDILISKFRELGINEPDTMWNIGVEDGKLYLVCTGDVHTYRMLEMQRMQDEYRPRV